MLNSLTNLNVWESSQKVFFNFFNLSAPVVQYQAYELNIVREIDTKCRDIELKLDIIMFLRIILFVVSMFSTLIHTSW